MGSPAIFSGSYTKLLSSSGIQKSDGTIMNFNGPINYISNYGAFVNTTGWATYSNTAANIPSSGTGGTATGLTFSRTTTSPIRSPACFSMVQANSTNIQGKGVSYAFTIDPADQAKALSVQFDFNASSTFVAANGITAPLNDGTTTTNAGNSDVEVFFQDVTNSQIIYCTPQVITANGANNFTFKGILQTAANSTSYRLIFHVATANANATGWTFLFSNVYVGPQVVLQGPPITDWAAYTPTFTGLGTVTNINAVSRRFGDSLQLRVSFTTGTTTATQAQMTLGYNGGNANVTIDNSGKNPTTQTAGYMVQSGTSTSQILPLSIAGNNYLNFGKQDGSTGGITVENGSAMFSNSTTFSFFAEVPIAGWSSTTLMSNDASTRPIELSVDTAATSYTANTPVVYSNVLIDNAGGYNASTGRYTIPVSGTYDITATAYAAAPSGSASIYIYKNGSQFSQLPLLLNGAYSAGGGDTLPLIAGDIIDIRINISQTLTNASNARLNRFTVSLRQGPSAISATEKVFAQYTSTSVASVSTTTPVTYGTKVVDNFNAFNGTTFTAPRSGTYILNATFFVNTASYTPRVYKNGSFIYQGTQGTTASIAAINNQIFLNAGDTIDIRADNTYTLANTATISYFMISSQGGI